MNAPTQLTTAQNRKLYNTINLRETAARHEIINRRDPTTRTVARVLPGSQLHTFLSENGFLVSGLRLFASSSSYCDQYDIYYRLGKWTISHVAL